MDHPGGLTQPTGTESDAPSSEEEDVEVDLFQDLIVVTSQAKGQKEGECEDRILPKFKLPMEYMNSSASCVMLGVLDGHGGRMCVDYITKQLPVSVIAAVRDPQKRKLASDCDNLKGVITRAFKATDNNFLYIGKRQNDNSGSTIASCTFFGPGADDGLLRVLLASLGDSRAVLYRLDPKDSRKVVPVVSSPVHKPSTPSEIKRIQAEGGQVSRVQGIDRVIKKINNQNTIGLSVSRAFGDMLMKFPKPVISNVPDFTDAVIDFDKDQFLVLGSDGIFDFMSMAEVGALVLQGGRTQEGLQRAADLIVAQAKAKGSTDDRTCIIVDFAWAIRPETEPTRQRTTVAEDEHPSDDDIFK